MADYRIYCMDGAGHIHYSETLEASDDQDAFQKAHDLKMHSVKCEVWLGDRLVATLDAEDLSS